MTQGVNVRVDESVIGDTDVVSGPGGADGHSVICRPRIPVLVRDNRFGSKRIRARHRPTRPDQACRMPDSVGGYAVQRPELIILPPSPPVVETLLVIEILGYETS